MIRSRNRRSSPAEMTRAAVLEALENRQMLSTYFVSTGGNNTAAGDQAHPWSTLQFAANQVKPGDIVNVTAGNYAGFQLSTSGTAGATITFNAAAGTIINGTPTDLNGYIDLSGDSYVTLNGFNIQASGTAARAGIWGGGYVGADVTNVTIENNSVNGADWWGILFGHLDNSLITGNTVSNTQVQHGIYVGNSSQNDTISDNTSFGNHGCGIEINADGTDGGVGISKGMILDGNKLYDNALSIGAEINLDGVQDSTVENNLIYGGQRNGIALYDIDGNGPSSGDLLVNNTIYINSEGPAGYGAISLLNSATNTTILNNVLSAAEDSLIVDPSSIGGLKSDYNIFGASGVDPTGQTYANNISFTAWQAKGFDNHSVFVGSNIGALFVDTTTATANFNLASGSAAIGAGTSTDAPALDYAGHARPTAGRYDIGALQYQGTAPVTPPVVTPPPVTSPTPPPVTTPGQMPATPTGLAVSANSTSGVTIVWTDAADDATKFAIELSVNGGGFSLASNVPGTTHRYVDPFVKAGWTYAFEIVAENAVGNSAPTSVVTAVVPGTPTTTPPPTPTPTLPATPTGLAIFSSSTAGVTLTWADTADDATKFVIDRSVNGGAFALDGSVAGSLRTYLDPTVTAGTTYTYEIMAVNTAGDSSPSTIARTVIPTPTPPPTSGGGSTGTGSTGTGTGSTHHGKRHRYSH